VSSGGVTFVWAVRDARETSRTRTPHSARLAAGIALVTATGMRKQNHHKKPLALTTHTVRTLAETKLTTAAGGLNPSLAKSIITCCIPPE